MIKNKINGKIYVGKTKRTLAVRVNEHIKGAADSLIHRAIIKYGFENFEVSVLEKCNSMEELNEREKFWISKLNSKVPNGYNLTDGGDGGLGHVVTLETRQKISTSKTGKSGHPPSEKQLRITAEIGRKSKGRKLRPRTEEEKKHLSELFKGRKISEETKAKMVASNWNRRTVRCKETGELFSPIGVAAQWAGVCDGTIIAACKNPNRTAGGYHWEYADNL